MTVTVGTLRVRSAAADSGALRMRVARQLQAADFAPPALPPTAVLVVRRLADPMPGRFGAGHGRPPPEWERAVRDRVASAARSAARPDAGGWLAPGAEAVLFADEAEMAACVVRDWLRSAVAERWWWRGVLAGAGADVWLRAHVLARGEVLVPVLALLAERGDAVAWATRLSAAEAEWAADAVVRAYALETAEQAHEPVSTPHLAPRVPDARRDALARVLGAVPEARDATLAPPQRRMLAVALAVAREPVWARSPQLATALRALDAVTPLELAAFPVTPESRAGDVDAASHPRSIGDDAVQADREIDPEPSASAVPHRGTTHIHPSFEAVEGAADRVRDVEAAHPPPARRPRLRRADIARSMATDGFAAGLADVPSVERLRGVASTDPMDVPATAAPTFSDAVDASRVDVDAAPVEKAQQAEASPELDFSIRRSVETEFGGIFYLLNAALALQLYGDFTMPRAKGLALLPWDLLAMVGRAWFGAEFVADPVWRALASLAGRSAKEPPGTYFHPPKEWVMPADWLAPWGQVAEVRVHATRARLRVLHPAGFAVCDVPRDPALQPMAQAQARALCATYPHLRGATLRRAGSSGTRTRPRAATARWLAWLLDFLAARLALALFVDKVADIPALLCRHPARVAVSASAVDVHLSLADLPLPVRVAGLDRDAGWIPAAGRSLSFHFS